MAITKSAKKALRQNLKRRQRNLQYQVRARKLEKEIKKLASLEKKEDIQKLLPKIYQAFDKAAKKGVLKKQTAARKKSRISRLLQKAKK